MNLRLIVAARRFPDAIGYGIVAQDEFAWFGGAWLGGRSDYSRRP